MISSKQIEREAWREAVQTNPLVREAFRILIDTCQKLAERDCRRAEALALGEGISHAND